MNSKAFIFIGRSGCGKGTQADLLTQWLYKTYGEDKVIHAETGALLRVFIKGDSYSQKLTKTVVESGGLLPEVVPIAMWSTHLFNNYTGKEFIIFDGCPRKPMEASILDSTLKFYSVEKPTVFYLEVDPNIAKARLLARARKDDTEEGIAKRMAWFETDVLPSMKIFEGDPYYNVAKIDGGQDPHKVHEDILAALGVSK